MNSGPKRQDVGLAPNAGERRFELQLLAISVRMPMVELNDSGRGELSMVAGALRQGRSEELMGVGCAWFSL